LEGRDGTRLREERTEIRALTNNRVRGKAAEVALERSAPLADEVVALYHLPLEDALVGPGRDEEAAVGCGKAVREGHHVAEAPPHADLPAAASKTGGDEVRKVAAGPRDHTGGTPAAGLRVLLGIGYGDFGEHWRRRIAARCARRADDAGRRCGGEVVLVEEVVDDEVVVARGGRGGRWPEEGVGRGGGGSGGGRRG